MASAWSRHPGAVLLRRTVSPWPHDLSEPVTCGFALLLSAFERMIEGMDGGAVTVTRAAVVAPTVGWAAGPLGAVQAAARETARPTAVQARAVAEFAAFAAGVGRSGSR